MSNAVTLFINFGQVTSVSFTNCRQIILLQGEASRFVKVFYKTITNPKRLYLSVSFKHG